MFLTPYTQKDNRVSNYGRKERMNNSKVGLKALVNLATQQREQQHYRLPSIGSWSGNIQQLYFLNQPCPFCL